jgi:ssDNA-binding Zn-finger/Zn-ribbon topoisomerase 1
MVRVEEKVFICPKCRRTLTSKAWAAPMCPREGCNKQMRRDTTGREGVFVKQ